MYGPIYHAAFSCMLERPQYNARSQQPIHVHALLSYHSTETSEDASRHCQTWSSPPTLHVPLMRMVHPKHQKIAVVSEHRTRQVRRVRAVCLARPARLACLACLEVPATHCRRNQSRCLYRSAVTFARLPRHVYTDTSVTDTAKSNPVTIQFISKSHVVNNPHSHPAPARAAPRRSAAGSARSCGPRRRSRRGP